MSFDLRQLGYFGLFCGADLGIVCVFEQYLVTVIEDTRIVLAVTLPTSLRTPSSLAFHTPDEFAVAAQDVNASFMKQNTNY